MADSDDTLAADVLFSPELAAVRDTARRFRTRYLGTSQRAQAQAGALDRNLVAQMGRLGLIAPELPVAFGGSGLGALASGAIIEEIAKGDLSLSYVQTLGSLTGAMLAAHAREELATHWLGRIASGSAIVALALTEPQGGSDAAALRLRMRRDGNCYVLNGEKTSISAAEQADAAVVFARTGSESQRARGVSALLVPLDLPGVRRQRFDDVGCEAVGRGSLFFDDVVVPVDHLLGEEGQGFGQVMRGFDFSRALIGLSCLGVARVCLDETWRYVTERCAFGQQLSTFQGVTHPLAEFDTQVEAARLLCMTTLWLRDREMPHSAQAAMCKWWAPALAFDTVQACLLRHGHAGYSKALPFEQRLRDVLGLQIGDGTAQVMKSIIARHRAGRHNVPY